MRCGGLADFCSLITSLVCCQVTRVGCIHLFIYLFFIVLFTGPIFPLCFISVLFPVTSALLATVNVYKAKLPFVSNIYSNVLLNNFLIPSFVLFMHKKI